VTRLLVAAAIVVVVALVALALERRRPQPPTQARPAGAYPVPTQLDRDDFDHTGADWLVVVFTSATCESCAEAVAKAQPLASGPVAVTEVEVGARPRLHRRYGIEAVPTIVLTDAEGVVRASFVGNPPAAELWAAVAEVRTSAPGDAPAAGSGGDGT